MLCGRARPLNFGVSSKMFAAVVTLVCTYLALVFGLLIALAAIQARFIIRLKSYQRPVWEELGEPAPLVGLSRFRGTADARLNRFFMLQRFTSLSDAEASRLGAQVYGLRRTLLHVGIIGGAIVGSIMWVGYHYGI